MHEGAHQSIGDDVIEVVVAELDVARGGVDDAAALLSDE